MFYIHTPFCEQLCWFCTCSKFITKDYDNVKEYLEYLYKEIDILFNFLNKNNIKLNVGTVFFGGGSPTILNREDLPNPYVPPPSWMSLGLPIFFTKFTKSLLSEILNDSEAEKGPPKPLVPKSHISNTI